MTDSSLKTTIQRLQDLWQNLNEDAFALIQNSLKDLAENDSFRQELKNQDLSNGLLLHQDSLHGFGLYAYTESKGTYRIPHDHGVAWVIYLVIAGEMEMRNYFKVLTPEGHFKLIQKNGESLKASGLQIYYPSDIHDTRCMSDQALILRLTSHDLKEEERLGRMLRFPIQTMRPL